MGFWQLRILLSEFEVIIFNLSVDGSLKYHHATAREPQLQHFVKPSQKSQNSPRNDWTAFTVVRTLMIVSMCHLLEGAYLCRERERRQPDDGTVHKRNSRAPLT